MSKNEAKRRKLNVFYDESPSEHHEFNFKIAKRYLKNNKVLDLGCWSGQFSKLASQVAKKVVGVDPNIDAINYAKKTIPTASFIQAKANNLPFDSNTFDTVVFLEVIEHLPTGSESKALGEIYRVLRPKGHLILSTPNNHPISILMDPAFFLIGHRHYSLRKIEALLKKSGFRVVKVFQTGGMVRLIKENIDATTKIAGLSKIKYPIWIRKLISKEYVRGGFAENHLVAIKKA